MQHPQPRPQPHPEVDGTSMIGWQPVFATSPKPNPPTATSSNFVAMLLLGMVALVLAAGGGVLFKVHQSMDNQKAIWQQEAISQERSRIMECIAPK